jgi:Right handed beta helix region
VDQIELCPRRASLCFLLLALTACGTNPGARLRQTLARQTTGVIHLPQGTIEISTELTLAPGAHDLEIDGDGTTLKASATFKGRALLIAGGGKNIRLHGIMIDGNRAAISKPLDMAPPENYFRLWYPNNGLLFDQVEGLEISNVRLRSITNFPILVSRSSNIKIANVAVQDSGSRNAQGRNNLSGGILIEEGSSRFEVRDSTFLRIAGNALWTHSLRISPRLQDGIFANNHFDTIGRDAIQIGHATRVRVEDNTGTAIGYPAEVVDAEHGGTPVGIDTAGNVDATSYARNRFEEVDGGCIDLDGFHDGVVRDNTCINRKPQDAYPFGHFGIVMNNTDPDTHSQNIEITGNMMDGMKYGGLFLMGSGHHVTGNKFLRLDIAGCNESAAKVYCIYKQDEPAMLESGIYLSRGLGHAEETRGNVIRDNIISGHKMKTRCIAFGPSVTPQANTLQGNTCSDDEPPQ